MEKGRGVIATVKSWFGGGIEGSQRGTFYGQGEMGNWFALGNLEDGFQRNLNIDGGKYVPVVYACASASARAASQCPMTHYKVNDKGEHVKQTTTPASRLFRHPNNYQTFNQLMYNVVMGMMFDGEAVVLITRDDRYAAVALHLMPRGSWGLYVDPDSREIFYSVGSNPMLETGIDMMVPARDVIHFRQYTPRHPLIGESPIKAAALALGINVALSQAQAAFFSRMNRPSGILSTEQTLTKEQMLRLREAFEEQSKKWASGGMPILSNGLKFEPMSVTSQDAQLIQAQRMSAEDIARCFGTPLPVIGDLSNATMNNVEQLINHWLAVSLGALFENIERSLDRAFNLGANEYVQFEESALLRTDFMGRIDGLTKAIAGGLMTPNEARVREGLAPVSDGDMPMVQQQMMPLNSLADFHQATIDAKLKPAAAAAPNPEPDPDPAKAYDGELAAGLLVKMIEKRAA